MKERQTSEPLALLPETRALLATVEAQTGCPVEIRAEPALRGHARASYVVSDPDRSRHLVLYDPHYRPLLDHLLAHECGHVFRFSQAAPRDRLLPAQALEHRNLAIRQLLHEIERLVRAGVTERSIAEVIPTWIGGIATQLANTPADIRIERWLHGGFPGLRPVQARSLEDQAREARRGLQPDVARLTPRPVWEASTAMNYALFSAAARFLERPQLVRPYHRTPAQRLGEELLEMVDSTIDVGLAGDRSLADRWAERLGVQGWFRWQPVDTLPSEFRRAWQ